MKFFLVASLLPGLALGAIHNTTHCTDKGLLDGTLATAENLEAITSQPTSATPQLEATVQIQIGNFTASVIVELTALSSANTSLDNKISTTTLPLNTTVRGKLSSSNHTVIPIPTTATPKFANETFRTNTTGRISGSFPFPSSISPPTLFTSGSMSSGDKCILMAYVSVVVHLVFMVFM